MERPVIGLMRLMFVAMLFPEKRGLEGAQSLEKSCASDTEDTQSWNILCDGHEEHFYDTEFSVFLSKARFEEVNMAHVFWQCAMFKKCITEAIRPRVPVDQLQERCVWPFVEESGVDNEQVTKWMVTITMFFWDMGYGRTEARNTEKRRSRVS